MGDAADHLTDVMIDAKARHEAGQCFGDWCDWCRDEEEEEEVRKLMRNPLMTDTERLNWLEKHSDGGGVFNDDRWGGPLRWAFSASGFQPVVDSEPLEGQWVFWVEKDDWKPSIREAIDHAIATLSPEPADD